MTYVLSAKQYQSLRKGFKENKGMSHKEIIQHINDTFGLHGTVTKLRIV